MVYSKSLILLGGPSMTFLILWYMVPFWGDSIKEAIGNWQVEVTFGKS